MADGTRLVFSYQSGGRLEDEHRRINLEEEFREGHYEETNTARPLTTHVRYRAPVISPDDGLTSNYAGIDERMISWR